MVRGKSPHTLQCAPKMITRDDGAGENTAHPTVRTKNDNEDDGARKVTAHPTVRTKNDNEDDGARANTAHPTVRTKNDNEGWWCAENPRGTLRGMIHHKRILDVNLKI